MPLPCTGFLALCSSWAQHNRAQTLPPSSSGPCEVQKHLLEEPQQGLGCAGSPAR